MANKPRKKPAQKQAADKRKTSKKQPSEALQLASFRLKNRVWGIVQVLAYFVGFGIVLLCADPLVTALAGKNTNVNLKISLVVGVSLAGVAAAVSAWGRYQYKQARHFRRRNRELVARLKQHGVSVPDDGA